MSEYVIDLESMVRPELGPFEVLAPGALDSQVGKTVPVTIGLGENKRTIGEAVIFKDGEGVIAASIRLALTTETTN